MRAGRKNAVPVPRVLWRGAYRTHRSSGYGYECPTELPEVSGTGMKVLQNFQKFRVLFHGRTELLKFTGRYKKCRVRVIPGYTRPRERSSIRSGAFNPTCMACSHWANVPEAIRSCCGHYRQPPLSPRRGRLPLPALFQLSSGPLIFVLFTPRLCAIARLSHS